MNLQKRHNKKGMSLVEIIAGIALLGIISAMVFTVFVASAFMAVNSGNNTFVAEVANSAMTDKIMDQNGDESTATVYFNVDDFAYTESATITGKHLVAPATSMKDGSEWNETTLKAFIPVSE